MQPIAYNKGKGLIPPDDDDTPTDDELSSGSSQSLNLSPAKNAQESIRTKSHKRPSPHPNFNDASRKAGREAGRREYRSGQALGDPPMLPPVSSAQPAFGTTPTFYTLPRTLIQRPDDMLFSPLREHILDYKPPHGFSILAFTTFDDLTDPYDHMLHYN